MPIVDDKGNIVPPDKVAVYLRQNKAHATSYPVSEPSEVPAKLGNALTRNLPVLAAQGGGEYAGGLAGGALAALAGPEAIPAGVFAGKTIGAGLGNVAAGRLLPRRFGGSPTESIPSLFAWGAVPSAGGNLAAKAFEARAAAKAAAAARDAREAFQTEAEASAKDLHKRVEQALSSQGATPETVERVKQAIGKADGQPYSADNTSSVAQKEAFQARDAVLGPINRLRDKFGEPLNAAYKSIKDQAPISEQEAADISDAAQDVRDELISPAPKAAEIFNRIKKFRRPLEPSSNDLWRMSPAEREHALYAVEHYKPPTPDELRELRQQVNAKLRTADGGDAHALRDLQSALDEHLSSRLPPNIQELRGNYYHFINNYPWREIRAMRRLGTPAEMSAWLFDKKGPQSLEIIRNATNGERDVYRRMFYNHVLSGVDENLPAEAQMAQLAKSTEVYRRNGVARALFGDQASRTLDGLIYMPKHIADFAKMWKDPIKAKAWQDEFLKAANKAGKVDRAAAEAGLDAWMNTMSPAQQRIFKQLAGPLGDPEPVMLPSPQRKMVEQIHENAAKSKINIKSRLGWAIPMGLAGAVLGRKFGVTYSASVVATLGAMFATQEAYKAFIRNGGADLIARLYTSEGGRMSGAAAFHAFVLLGGRMLHQGIHREATSDAGR